MSASDNEFEQLLNELNDILSIGAANTRVARVRTLLPTFLRI